MKKLIIIWALLISVCYAQSKPGFYVVGGKVITVQDTSSRNYLKAIENAGVVPSVVQNAASNYLVTSEKAIGSYSLMTAQYPFIGGNAATHIFNLNKPTGLASDYTLQFFGTVTHSANGMQGDGGTGFADTKLIETNLNRHLSFYSSTNTNLTGSTSIGAFTATSDQRLILRRENNGFFYLSANTTATDLASFSSLNSIGAHIGTINSNVISLIKNGIILSPLSTGDLGKSALPSVSYYIMATNSTGTAVEFDNKMCGYASIGAGFTDDIAISQSRIVTFFNSMQNR